MTDKQIIIDGVDVSGCAFLDDYSKSMCNGFRGDNSGFHQGHCIQNPNCYFKQLARKTQECEEQRTKLEYYVKKTVKLLDDMDDMFLKLEELDRYSKALERIKETVGDYDDRDLTTTINDIISEVKDGDI